MALSYEMECIFPEIAAWQDQEGSGKKGTGIWRDPPMKAWRLVRGLRLLVHADVFG